MLQYVGSICLPGNSAIMSTLTMHYRWEHQIMRETTLLYAKANKVKLLTLHTLNLKDYFSFSAVLEIFTPLTEWLKIWYGWLTLCIRRLWKWLGYRWLHTPPNIVTLHLLYSFYFSGKHSALTDFYEKYSKLKTFFLREKIWKCKMFLFVDISSLILRHSVLNDAVAWPVRE